MALASHGARLQLSCRGVVQGVGARPALQRLASRLGLRGSLQNSGGGLAIDLCGTRPALEAFLSALPATLPASAQLDQLDVRWLPSPHPPWPEGVRIAAAPPQPLGRALVAPGLSADRSPCAACLAELEDPRSRRHRYPFISCCACGPRFSLVTALPFCRAHTTLASFPPCPSCAREFRDPADRRFHAETISCPACGPSLALLDGAGHGLARGEAALTRACERLRAGEILALQGVGGFQLLVDATNPDAVKRLRQRKQRPAKPFALLVAEARTLEPAVMPSAAAMEALSHPAAPIVLLPRRWMGPADPWDLVAPHSPALGVMLPASGLHHLLAREVGCPLVATSGNRSGDPLCTNPKDALAGLAGIADGFLVHDLPIARPLDDSLLQLIHGRPTLLRRARGFVPEPLPWHAPACSLSPTSSAAEGAMLALGGDLKAAPALVRGDRVWLAPHLGDLGHAAVARRWEQAVEEHMASSTVPVAHVAGDAHPGYGSHQRGQALAERHHLPFTSVPHHLAHGLAALAEWGRQPPLLILACDGLGLADPRGLASGIGLEQLWGGEVLFVHGLGSSGLRWQRLAALRPFPLPGGERASREPRRCALGLLAAAGDWALLHPGALPTLEAFSIEERELLLGALAAGCQAPLTSSLGRLIDGVASLLGLVQTLSYEGEGGLRWQGAAARWLIGPLAPHMLKRERGPWRLPLVPPAAGEAAALPLGRWDWEPLLRALLAHGAGGGSCEQAAWWVERSLVEALLQGALAAATWSGCQQVALAGGCFQNSALLEGCIRELREAGLDPLWGERAPCNDAGLALGQAWATQAWGGAL